MAELPDGALVVVFTSQRGADDPLYTAMAREMDELAASMPGYLGHESVRGADGVGITVSYWESEDAIAAWKKAARHQLAQAYGRDRWYEAYSVVVARVTRAYAFERSAES